jgi:hypothetical protein
MDANSKPGSSARFVLRTNPVGPCSSDISFSLKSPEPDTAKAEAHFNIL